MAEEVDQVNREVASSLICCSEGFGERLKRLRLFNAMTLDQFGRHVCLGKGYLSKLERGRRSGLSRRAVEMICERFRVRTEWLVEGKGQPFERAENTLPPLRELLKTSVSDRQRMADSVMVSFIAQVAFKTPAEVLDRLIEILSRRPLPVPLIDVAAEMAASLRPHLQKNCLTEITEVRTNDGVPSEVQNLVSRLRKATSSPGKKAALAEFLGVARPRVSEWLSGKTVPSGETTLRLLHWVEVEEQRTKT